MELIRRGRTATLEVPDPTLSSAHAQLARGGDAGAWVVTDLGSKNGVFADGARVSRAALHDGALVRLGGSYFLYRVGPDTLPDEHRVASDQGPLATLSPRLEAQFRSLRAAASSSVNIVLSGEVGTGKAHVARAFHAIAQPGGPFVALSCGGAPQAWLETELFGPRRGVHSVDMEDARGLLLAAHGGTLFLKDVGDLPLPVQSGLLRVLRERRVVTLGGSSAAPAAFRLIASTRRPLGDAVRAGKFNADLFTRIAGFSIQLLPLRERREDLGAILAASLRAAPDLPAEGWRVSPAAADALMAHPWPGNIGQLARVVESATLLAREGKLGVEHLEQSLLFDLRSVGDPGVDLSDQERALRRALVDELRANQGNVSAVARSMGKARMQIQRWLRRFGLEPRNPNTWTDLDD